MKPIIVACCLFALFALAGPVSAAEVSQGKCILYDQTQAVITIEEFDTRFSTQDPYGRPTGVKAAFDVSKAVIGITPEPGDVLRLAYNVQGDRKVALRVMNVSKQDLRKK
jgi:hypothetical protein